MSLGVKRLTYKLRASAGYDNALLTYSQLFGEADADEEVSPDTEDPEAVGAAGERAAQAQANEHAVGGIERTSTRAWAEKVGYDPVKLFNKVSPALIAVLRANLVGRFILFLLQSGGEMYIPSFMKQSPNCQP